ncbi:uncharacterized protein LOC106089768 isoform X1 [Stomoxys calcitrans]|uniref:uncharacterized protein LOC106089768 isoform X1 n=1 Tax=Stomoxys calcitrans TaxID=35570 RepID=UPI0027E2DAD7|nr:uncharacterized protein LOC106089768 isoform X1 [Stomoxys calcitrans]
MLKKRKIFFLLLALSLAVLTKTAKRRFNVVIKNTTCQVFSPVMKQFDCAFKMLSPSNYLIDTSFMYARELNENAEWQGLIYFSHLKGSKPIKFLDIKMNICSALSTAMTVPIVKMIMEETRKTSNLPYECPLKANFLYSYSNFSMNAKILPAYAPLIKFNFSLNTFDNRVLISKYVVEGSTVQIP